MLLAALMMQGALALQQPAELPTHGLWGAATVALDRAYFTKDKVTVRSPDGRSFATAMGSQDQESFSVETSGAMGHGIFHVAAGPNQELLWSPDSQALFVTADDGGIVGSYELTVIGRFRGKLVRRNLTKWHERRFGHPCQTGYIYNVAGIAWLLDSRRLLTVVEVPNDSGCVAMGMFRVYEIDPFRMRLLKRLSEKEARHAFPSALGPLLRNDEAPHVR